MVSLDQEVYLQPNISRLRDAILINNHSNSVEGLLAHHILENNAFIDIEWEVGCSQEWIETQFKPANLEHVAILGYALWGQRTTKYQEQLLEGLCRIQKRDAFRGGHLSLAHQPKYLLGIILGSIALEKDGADALNWCKEVLHKIEQEKSNPDPIIGYLIYRAFKHKRMISDSDSSLYQLAFMDWGIRHQIYENELSQEQINEKRQKILFKTALDLQFDSATQAAFILSSVSSIILHSLSAVSLQTKHVSKVLRNFETAMRRWRWDEDNIKTRINWPITQEREVQDILWLILHSYFPDVIDEDTLPKLGHSSYRVDFGIPDLKLIIEVKFSSKKSDFKKIEKEILEDTIPYLRDKRYESLIVFIYDDSVSVQEHDITRRALLEISDIVDVIIVSRPSQLPSQKSQEILLANVIQQMTKIDTDSL